mmetsp:Transcript_84795/g.127130  ORF Transcript_84795/g.127130 Transcript_84795/m.127130 type:complete len:245 (+) Transcript_84795:515-1249(+)
MTVCGCLGFHVPDGACVGRLGVVGRHEPAEVGPRGVEIVGVGGGARLGPGERVLAVVGKGPHRGVDRLRGAVHTGGRGGGATVGVVALGLRSLTRRPDLHHADDKVVAAGHVLAVLGLGVAPGVASSHGERRGGRGGGGGEAGALCRRRRPADDVGARRHREGRILGVVVVVLDEKLVVLGLKGGVGRRHGVGRTQGERGGEDGGPAGPVEVDLEGHVRVGGTVVGVGVLAQDGEGGGDTSGGQ